MMNIKWEVSDGYVGASRPQETKIDDNEILECDSIDEALERINNCIQHDFDEKITYSAESIVGKLKKDGLFDKLVLKENEADNG